MRIEACVSRCNCIIKTPEAHLKGIIITFVMTARISLSSALSGFARSERMLVESTAMRGSLDPDPDPTRPFDVSGRFIAFARRTGVDNDVFVASTRGA